jgi:3-(3-hydroxy-phenyl)propionate hydroxylase
MSRGQRVVLAGAGPVGLVVAIELARRGLKPILLDPKREIAWSSRAICVSRRSQEIFRRIGITEAFFEKALPWSSGKTFHRDKLVFRLEMPFSPADRFAPFVNIQQLYTEQFLLDTLESLGPDAIDTRWGHAIESVEQHDGGGEAIISCAEGPYNLAFDWIVAADGARSAVRASLGHTLHGTSYEGRYLIADIKVEGAVWPVERHVWFDPISNADSTVIVHVQPDGIWRIDIQIDPSLDDAAALDDAFLHPLIGRHLSTAMGVVSPFEVLWRSVYRAHALTMHDYRDRRVLFAGDAAHLVPIFGVRGLNSGIDDAHNLAWKLAMVVKGQAEEKLLDSYTEERRAATLENLGNAIKSTWFMSPPNRRFRILRDAVLRLAESKRWARELINPRQSAAHVYRASSVIQYDATRGPTEPGAVVPSVQLPDGRFLHDLLATDRLTLLSISDDAEGIATDVALSLGLHFVAMPAESFDEATRPTCSFLLVRPDEHIAAAFASLDAQGLKSAIDRALGRNPQNVASFVPAEHVDQVVPYTPAEALFLRLATEEQLEDGDVSDAMEMLMRGMMSIEAEAMGPSRLEEVDAHRTLINNNEEQMPESPRRPPN